MGKGKTKNDTHLSKRLLELIKDRRSVRYFNGAKIPKKEIIEIIEAGIWAPTGCNNQELRFFTLDKEVELKEILRFKPFFKGVSTVVLIFCDMSSPMSIKMYLRYRFEKHLPYVDTGLALSNMILYAESKGIDSCVFNLSEYHFRRNKNRSFFKRLVDKFKRKLGLHKFIKENFEFYLRRSLKIPGYYKIMGGVAFGYAKVYPDIIKASHGRRKIMRGKVEDYIIKRIN